MWCTPSCWHLTNFSKVLGSSLPFEIPGGMNCRAWVRACNVNEIMIFSKSMECSEYMTKE